MPYRLEQSGSGYYVVGPSGRHSRKPLPRRRAAAQMRALYAAETKDASTTAGAPLHGPGGLLATPGMGGRRWGNRRKDKACTCGIATKEQLAPGITRIRGNLCNVHGRYGPCDVSQSGKRKPTKGRKGRAPAKPKVTPEQRAQERQAQRQDQRDQVLHDLGIDSGASEALVMLRNGEQPEPAALARMGAIAAGLVEQAADGTYRMTPSGRALLSAAESGDVGRAGDIISGARDRTSTRTQRQEAAAQRKRDAEAKRSAAEAKKPPKAASGGGEKQPDRAADREQRVREHQEDRARRQREHEEDRSRRQRERDEDRARAQREGMTDARQRMERSAPADTSVERVPTHTTRIDRPKRKPGPRKRQTTKEYNPSITVGADGRMYVGGPFSNGDAIARWDGAQWSRPSFTVFKDATGAHRWIARTTTAYRDRDGEIITIKALDDDAQRMAATRQYGPLRYWHVGQPDPFDPVAPWGPGLDIGDCDYSIVIGRTAIESGTFKSAAIGQAFADSAADYELSPGFFHPPDQPNVAGEYAAIRRFERSVVPIKYGRASNLFTGLTVKEHRMDEATYKARVDAYLKDMREKGVPPEVAAGQLASMEQADKSAQQQGIAYKSDDAPAAESVDPWAAVITALKAAVQPGPPASTAGVVLKAEPPAEMLEAADTEAMDAEAELADDAGPAEGGEYIGDMTPQEFWAQLQQYLAPVLKMQEMHKAMSDMMGEMKGMYATKDASTAQRFVAIEATLARLAGDQPAVVTNEALEALKSAGPQAPPDANAPQIPDDASPLTHLAARTMPALYTNNPNGQFNGWVPPAPLPQS